MTSDAPDSDERWLVRGRVQGVCYRAFTQEAARALGVHGWVRNLPDGRVEARVVGPTEALNRLEGALRDGPPAARVDGIDRDAASPRDPAPDGFEIRPTPTHVPRES